MRPNDKTVWIDSSIKRAYLCRGIGVDEFIDRNQTDKDTEDGKQTVTYDQWTPEETRLIYDRVKGIPAPTEESSTITVFYAINDLGERSSLYLTEDELTDSYGYQFMMKDGRRIESIELDLRTIKPITDSFRVYLTKTKDDRFRCAINAHPEYDGTKCPGKYFFPDKSWENPCEGWARVTPCHETKTYGFVTGKMEVHKRPLKDTLVEILLQRFSDGYAHDAQLFFCEHPLVGTFVYERLDEGKGTVYTQNKKRAQTYVDYIKISRPEIARSVVEECLSNPDYIKETSTIFEQILTHFYPDLTLEDYDKMFPNYRESLSRFSLNLKYGALAGEYSEEDDALITRATECGALKAATVEGRNVIDLFSIDEFSLPKFTEEFTLDEIRTISEIYNCVNKESLKVIQGMIKKGQVSLKF